MTILTKLLLEVDDIPSTVTFISAVHERYVDCRYKNIDRALVVVRHRLENYTPRALIIILRSTYRMRHRLPHWVELRDVVCKISDGRLVRGLYQDSERRKT